MTTTILHPAASKPPPAYPAPALCPAQLDRLADARLQHGFTREAERLARLAAELRGEAP